MNGQNILGVMTGLGFFSNIDVNELAVFPLRPTTAPWAKA